MTDDKASKSFSQVGVSALSSFWCFDTDGIQPVKNLVQLVVKGSLLEQSNE